MTDNAAASWLPARGRFSVNMGPSFTRTMKLRKNEPPPNARHERHYHALRCSFKPATVDITKPGAVEFHKSEEARIVKVERPSMQTNDEVHLFQGQDIPAKDLDCILIFDEDTKTFTIEKLDSVMNVTYDKKIPKEQQRATGSPMPSSGHSTSVPSPDSMSLAQSTSKKPPVRAAAEHNDLETREVDPKTRGTLKPSKPPPPTVNLTKAKALAFRKNVKKPAPPPPRKEEGEASEGEIIESPRIPPEPVRAPPPVTASTSQSTKAVPSRKTVAQRAAELRAAAAAAQANASAAGPPVPPTHSLPPKPPAPTPSPQKVSIPIVTNKRPAPEEPPSKPSPPKRAKASPPPPTRTPIPPKAKKEVPKPKEKKPLELALPGAGPGLALPGAPSAPPPKPTSLAFPGSGAVAPSLPPPLSNSVPADVDSEEEDWDVIEPPASIIVAPPPAPVSLLAPRSITMEEIEPEPTVHREELEEDEEEIDADMFAQEMDKHLGDDEDFLTAELNKHMGGEDEEEDDFLAAAISPVVENQSIPSDRPPMSIGDLMAAQGGDNGDDGDLWGEDDSSSDDDSDDD